MVAALAQPTEIFVPRATEIFGLLLPPVRTLGRQPFEQFCSEKEGRLENVKRIANGTG